MVQSGFNQVTPVYHSNNQAMLDNTMQLVSPDDLYSADGSILLARAGQGIELNLIPHLIQFGVDPSQLRLQRPIHSKRPVVSSHRNKRSKPSTSTKNLLVACSTPRLVSHIEHYLTPNIQLDGYCSIEEVAWVLQQKKPDILLLDLDKAPLASQWEWIQKLAKNANLQQIIVLLPEALPTNYTIPPALTNVSLFRKPLNRFSFKKVCQSL